MNNSYAFDIEGAGQWTVNVTEVHRRRRGRHGDGADCTISTRRRSSRRSSPVIRTDERLPALQLKPQGYMGAAMNCHITLPELSAALLV